MAGRRIKRGLGRCAKVEGEDESTVGLTIGVECLRAGIDLAALAPGPPYSDTGLTWVWARGLIYYLVYQSYNALRYGRATL